MTQVSGNNEVKRKRTCIACGATSDKLELLRIVRIADGSVVFDETGRVPGRGAYVCSLECFNATATSKRLGHALKTQVSKEDYARIAGELERLANRVEG